MSAKKKEPKQLPLAGAPNPPLYAFWPYASFPYVLGGPVVALGADGRVQIKGYQNTWWRPLMLTSIEYGKKIDERLKALTVARDAELKNISDAYERSLKKLFDEHAVPHPKTFKE